MPSELSKSNVNLTEGSTHQSSYTRSPEKVSALQIGDWKSAGSVAPLYRELTQIGLESNIAELDAFGFTVVPPEKVGPPEFCDDVRKAL